MDSGSAKGFGDNVGGFEDEPTLLLAIDNASDVAVPFSKTARQGTATDAAAAKGGAGGGKTRIQSGSFALQK